MNPAEAEFLYMPVFYWGASVLLLYRHDLSRLRHSFRDIGASHPYAPYLIFAAAISLSWLVPAFPRQWYFLLIAQGTSGLVLTMATVKHLGPPPRKPYVDVLRYPRLGSRIRHLQSTPEKPEEPKERIRFYNVSLRNGTVVSTPSYPEKQAFCATLIHALEAADPDFAWIQFLFVKSDHGSALVKLKNSIERAKGEIERPALDFISGREWVRRELGRDFYRLADSRMKKVDDVATKPMVMLAIQGMWVSKEDSSRVDVLPFDHCSDEHDCLAVFQYRDLRMLHELVGRRMVTDIGEYLDRYTKSRLEPPSFMATPEGLESFIHLPAGEMVESLRSLTWGNSARGYNRAKVQGDAKPDSGLREDVISSIVRVAGVPKMEKILEDDSIQPLAHLASATVRTFELVYSAGHTELLLSAETVDDMRKYAHLLDSVYGDLDLEATEKVPEFLRQLLLNRALGL
jgi:hypothetical protein